MYASILNIGGGFFKGCAGMRLGYILLATHSHRSSRIDSGNTPKLPFRSRFMKDHRRGLGRNPFKALRYINLLLDTTTPASASL